MLYQIEDDVLKTIRIIEESSECVLDITKKTIYAFLNGYFSENKYNIIFRGEPLFGKYETKTNLDTLIKDGLQYLIDTGKIGYFTYNSQKKHYYTLSSNSNLSTTNIIANKKLFINKIINSFPSIPFSLKEFEKHNEKTFLKCMIECYPLIDEKVIKVERIYSWIDSFKTMKDIIGYYDFEDNSVFLFEFRLTTKKQDFYLDLVIFDEKTTKIIEFKQKTLDQLLGDSSIQRKAAYELSIYNECNDDDAMSYILCTRDKSYRYADVDERMYIVTPNSIIAFMK